MNDVSSIAIEYRPGEYRAAAIDTAGRVMEFRVERMHDQSLVGGIYLGRVSAVRNEIGAAFVDLGRGDDAFLNLHSFRKNTPVDIRGTVIIEGAAILVQVDRDPTPGKGARLTLKTDIVDLPESTPCPSVIAAAPSLPVRALHDWLTPETRQVIVDDARTVADIRVLTAEHDNVEIVHATKDSAFATAGIDEIFDDQLSPVVKLPGGGSLIIERTSAMTTIDVNVGQGMDGTASRAALQTNLEAATAIADTLRLRNIGGLMAVDFLKMDAKADNEQVVAALRGALSNDPAQVQTSGMSAFGVIEIARRQVSASITATFLQTQLVPSPTTLALDALHDVRKRRGTSATITAALDVIAQLKGPLKNVKTELEAELGFVIQLDASPDQANDTYRVS